jgi:2-keto-4-pentenoate hydratase/2-oxohepta-3-ene-1,7-dioic acid hydratase in catechol pathway
MRLVTYKAAGAIRVGTVVKDQVVDLSPVAPAMLELVSGGDEALLAAANQIKRTTERTDLRDVQLLSPFPRAPRNVFCVGLNYQDHVAEGVRAGRRNGATPDRPVWFTKSTTSICGPYDDIAIDLGLSAMNDWEAELAVVIGLGGRHISRENAMKHIHSYTVFNDFTARDLQHSYGDQWFKGKSLDQSSPMGPWLVTPEELEDPTTLAVHCRVNGETMQEASTSDLIFDIPTLIADISETITLLPGDIVSTGTPAGVGSSRTPKVFLQPGDVLETEIDRIGTLRNVIVEAQRASSDNASGTATTKS